MPIGVPKVPNDDNEYSDVPAYFEYDGDDDYASFIKKKKKEKDTDMELIHYLNGTGRIFIFEELNFEATEKLMGLMLLLDSEEDIDKITVYINSPGGHVVNGISLHDTMKLLDKRVCTVALGLAASTAALVLASGTKRHRAASENSRVMFHQPKAKKSPEYHLAGAMIGDAEYVMTLRVSVAKLLSEMGTQPWTTILADMNRDVFMSAAEAIDYGIIDKIREKEDEEEETTSNESIYTDRIW
uniref:ATP-dependent Clp protease proteolytic subunit n=1 Tax=Monopsis alba TaxID=2041135 RepID=A0A291F0Z9_9ASTR|nr:ATP-dependent protease proteolytic subunit [Monopsis alba]ATG25782.1 ATP-dependent protease proteolytic subunit [Monopsis alba]